MKLIYMLSMWPLSLWSQVGIETANPTATLDVNGTFRIRHTAQNPNEAPAKDSVLVVNKNGDVARTSSKEIINSYLKSFVKGGFSTAPDKNLSMSFGSKKIPFDFEDFDTNDEFNTATNAFTAKQNGIYAISVQIKANSILGIAGNFGVGIVKNSTIIAKSTFANLGVLGVNITPPFRNTTTLVELKAGETILFYAYCDLINIGLLGAKEDCFFTIHQVR